MEMHSIGEEVCRNLMEEDATTGRKRRELKQEKHRLTAFSERLARLVEQIREGDSNSERGQFEPATYSNHNDNGMPYVPEVEDDDDVMIVDDRTRV
jgi:hemerythrin-like domain-containing protein